MSRSAERSVIYWGAVSYLQIMASELSDKLLAEILELDAEMTVTMHIQTVDQLKAIKTIKGKISDIGKMKVEEQRKAVRSGYDPDILPPDLITFSKDAAELLADLQSRNERMFLLTFTVVNLAPTRQRLENDVFTVGGIAQKYNCALRRLDWQQEQGFVSSLALGYNEVEIQRGMTTSSTAIFIPFMTRELRMADKIRSVGMGGISADDDLAVEKLTKKLEGLESLQATMKAVNAYFRKHKTLDGCPELTPEQAEKLKADMAQSWHLDKSKPYPAYLLSNNNANIRRVRQRIEELSSRSEFAGWTFPGGEAKINEPENRLQLIFEEKPDANQRQELKSNGFKWAPSQGAWQRQLNQNAIRAAARIDFLRPEDGTSPYQLQPFVKRENKEMSR